jgi:hypothetical protein
MGCKKKWKLNKTTYLKHFTSGLVVFIVSFENGGSFDQYFPLWVRISVEVLHLWDILKLHLTVRHGRPYLSEITIMGASHGDDSCCLSHSIPYSKQGGIEVI